VSEPLALLPLAFAAGGGRLRASGDDTEYEAQQLVAAGLTLLQRSVPLVRALSGKLAAILLPTSPAFLVALAACEGRGAVLINPLASAVEAAFQCRDAGVGAVFTVTSLASRAPAGLVTVLLDDAPRSARVIADGVSRQVDLGSHFGLPLEGEREVKGSAEEAVLVYTSAMRGTPLGAILTHANLLANARSTVKAACIRQDEHMLALLPFSHLFGLTVTASAPLLAGARVTTLERFNPLGAAELLAGDVTAVVGVPAVFMALLSAIERRGVNLRESALRLCICGGAPLAVALQDRWAEVTGVELRQGYGLTEGGPVCLFNRADRPNVRGTLGVPFPAVEVGIFTPSSADARADEAARTQLRDGDVGEICVRGENVSPGYARDGDAGLPHRDGWLCTGDAGRRNADGTITFTGVLKPMFTRNGFNIYPREIERVVCALPGVQRVEVVAVPEPVREHDIHLRITGSVSTDEVQRWCAERLSAYKQPSQVEVSPG